MFIISQFCEEHKIRKWMQLTHCSLEALKRVTGNADLDQMPQNASSDQGLHYLQIVHLFFAQNI